MERERRPTRAERRAANQARHQAIRREQEQRIKTGCDEYTKIFHGDKASATIITENNPSLMITVDRLVQGGSVVGQHTLEGDTLYYRSKHEIQTQETEDTSEMHTLHQVQAGQLEIVLFQATEDIGLGKTGNS